MSNPERCVVVGVDNSAGSNFALDWAVDAAKARGVSLKIICAYRWVIELPFIETSGDRTEADRTSAQVLADDVVAKALARVAAIDPQIDASGEAVDGNAVPVLVEASRHAALLVVGSRRMASVGSVFLGSVSGAVSARAACPTVVVRGPVPVSDASVVVGVDGTPASQSVLAFAFDHASWHGVPLRAVLCWHPDLVTPFLGRLQPPPPEKAKEVLSEALAGWREKYPDVNVSAVAVRDYAVLGLVSESVSQRLLVVGSHGHHALTGTLLGSVSQGVLHHATCPVAVVPTADRG